MLKQLLDIIRDERRVLVDERITEQYLSDNLKRIKQKPAAVVLTNSQEEVSAVMKFAYQNNIPVIPRGAGTGLTGATVPVEGSIVIDLMQLNKIIELDKETFTLTVEAGMLLKDVQSFVEANNLFYPPDPGEKASTIGGNISTNAGGMRAVKYGVTRDYVRGLEVVLANGEVLSLGGKIIKNSSGLDIKDLIIGSEGTLAIITRALLKLIPKQKYAVSVLVPFNTLAEGIDTVIKIIGANTDIAAIEFMEKEAITLTEEYLQMTFPSQKGDAYLLFTFDGDDLSYIKSNYKKVEPICYQNGALDFVVLDNETLFNETWQIRGALVTAIEAHSEQEPIDIVVPINKSAEFIKYTKEIAKLYDIKIQSFGHAGDGNVHLSIVRGTLSDQVWQEKLDKVLEAVYKKGYELKGLPSGEHGIGITKKPYFLKYAAPTYIGLMKQIKAVFDEKHILNPHKVF